jgi:hypothetical protein
MPWETLCFLASPLVFRRCISAAARRGNKHKQRCMVAPAKNGLGQTPIARAADGVAIAPHSQNVDDGRIEFDLARALHFIFSAAGVHVATLLVFFHFNL